MWLLQLIHKNELYTYVQSKELNRKFSSREDLYPPYSKYAMNANWSSQNYFLCLDPSVSYELK